MTAPTQGGDSMMGVNAEGAAAIGDGFGPEGKSGENPLKLLQRGVA